ncbi:glutamate synthase-related protein [Fimbriimonas ginsengisoli]|uniref:Glutamate synthase n=1 Tax=Fimbriimonas ginsengisoli Gsoil 348 TaxID=661478 RepID=A0A068NUE5_FIMGI|nr:glutamate synthase-related protein [Fimbriimonas ginsengisoli]AIE86400.1 glutamate synthase [Fimbriimonas ginsengisoli Gsoil 348]
MLEADACGIGLLATRKGVAERRLVETALELTTRFDHRGAPGHGAGLQLDIPWPMLLDRFGLHAKAIAQRDVALGMFFLPFEAPLRRRCVETVERLAAVAGADVLQWADVPVNSAALDPTSSALRTLPIVRQALFRRPEGMSEDGWFACRYLLRLALDRVLGQIAGDEFSVVSLSNRTVVYKGLAELSRIAELYPDLRDPHFASRYVVFHSRYCTNTTTAWRRAQPFWAVAHNGEIATIQGNVAWMNAIGRDLIRNLVDRNPSLSRIAAEVSSIVCSGGSDTANLDDMMIALMAGGMSFPQAVLALLPPATSTLAEDDPLHPFARAASVYLGACDGPAALVGCDGDHAVAHLDRNGLRPLWVQTSRDYVMAVSELTGTLDLGDVETQRVMGPGDTVVVELTSGRVLFDEAVRAEVARHPFPSPQTRIVEGASAPATSEVGGLTQLQRAFGMTREDVDVLVKPLAETGKPAIGSMGDDTSPAAMLDALPRRMEDHFALRFAQETSPPIDPIRDAWVFDSTVALGDRSGLWSVATGPVYAFPHRVLSNGELGWLKSQKAVREVSLLFPIVSGDETANAAALEEAIEMVVEQALAMADEPGVLVLTDRYPTAEQAAIPPIRVVSLLHRRLVELGMRNRVGLIADVGVWDIHHCALLITLGADAVTPWLGLATAGEGTDKYLKGVRSGLVEAMSMMGVTPASAYCGAGLVEAVGLSEGLMRAEFPGVPVHLGGIGRDVLDREWLAFHSAAFFGDSELPDAGEFRHSKEGRRHANNAEVVRSLQLSSGYAKKIHGSAPGSREAFDDYKDLVNGREPVTVLDLLQVRKGEAIPIDEVESEAEILWRFMAPGMSEGALSEPAHRTVAKAFNVLHRYCRIKLGGPRPGIGPVANSGEGGFDKARIGRRDGNRSVQYAGGRFTITPMTAARAAEAEVKFAQGAKPGKGGQLPGKKVSVKVAHQRGCEPGYELVSPPINHNLYSIEDVKLMIESWRHLNPSVNCALKYVATHGVEMVAAGGVNAGANRLHLSDGCGGTGAAKRVDQKHAGVPLAAVLPTVHDLLVEEDVRHLVELSVDGGVQTGTQALKLFLLGADRVGFGTSLLISIGCSMLRKCHLSGPDPADPTGKRRLGCTPGIATQDPQWIARFAGDWRHIVRMLRFVAQEIRESLAAMGVRSVAEVIGRRDLLERKPGLTGKAAMLDLTSILSAPHGFSQARDLAAQSKAHMPALRGEELEAADRAMSGETVTIIERLTNESRCVGVGAAGKVARRFGDLGLPEGGLHFVHTGAAGHFYAAYSVEGLEFRLQGVVADSCFTAAYGGLLAVTPADGQSGRSLVGNAFGYGARGGRAYIAGRGGNRFGICLRKSHEGTGPRVVVEGVEANAFQYMTGGVALVLGPTGPNLGSGMTGGRVFLLDADMASLNSDYVGAVSLDEGESRLVREMLREHVEHTESQIGRQLLESFDASRFVRVSTVVKPELVPELVSVV